MPKLERKMTVRQLYDELEPCDLFVEALYTHWEEPLPESWDNGFTNEAYAEWLSEHGSRTVNVLGLLDHVIYHMDGCTSRWLLYRLVNLIMRDSTRDAQVRQAFDTLATEAQTHAAMPGRVANAYHNAAFAASKLIAPFTLPTNDTRYLREKLLMAQNSIKHALALLDDHEAEPHA